MRCVAACLARAGVVADAHLVLSDYDVKKRQHVDFAPDEASRVYAGAVLPAAHALIVANEEHPGAVASA